MILEVFPPLLLFWKSLRQIGVNFSLNVWQKSPAEPSGPGLFFLGRDVLLLLQFPFLCSSVRVSIFLDSVLVSYIFIGICPFIVFKPNTYMCV